MLRPADVWLSAVRIARSLRRTPGFVAIAALSLGTALGLSTALFGVIDAMRHPISGIRDVEQVRLVDLMSRARRPGPDVEEWQASLRQLPAVAEVAGMRRDVLAEVEIADRVDRRSVGYTRDGFWRLLDVHPRVGRMPTEAEVQNSSVAIVSDSLWRNRFANLPTVGPAWLAINGRRYSIVGVLPRNSNVLDMDVFVPDESPRARGMTIVRSKPGVLEKDFAGQLVQLTKRLTSTYLSPNDPPYSPLLLPVGPNPLELKDIHLAMIGASLCLLLIACANVAALMMARGTAKARDYALSLALGATPQIVFREVILEVLILGVIGTAVGALVATWTLALINGVTPEEMRWLGFTQPQWSLRVLAQSATAVFASVAIAGGYPAWRASRVDPAGPLKEGSGGHTGRGSTRFRLLVITELAVAMTLLVGTSLMVKSVRKMEAYDFGYDARHLTQANFWLFWRDSTTTEARQQLRTVWVDRIRGLPDVQSVARIDGCHADKRIVISDRTAGGGPSLSLTGRCMNVSAGFFQTLGVPLLHGRDFTDADADVGGAAILDEKTSRRLFGSDSPLGHAIKLGDDRAALPWLRIVGVVRDKRLDFDPYPEMGPDSSSVIFVSQPVVRGEMGTLVVRPKPGATNVAAAVRNTLRDLLPPRSSVRVRSWTEEYDTNLRVEQLLSAIFAVLGATSLVLGAAGIFSVVSYIAGQRNREFAVRIALGASGASILRTVMRDALGMALGGTAIGAGLGMWAGFLLWDKMWGVYPVDAGALILAEVTLIAVTLLACLLPALRAMRADPLDIIRAS